TLPRLMLSLTKTLNDLRHSAASAPTLMLVVALCVMLGACISVQVPRLPEADLPARWHNVSPQLGPKPDLTGWWRQFDDPELNALVEQALHDNLDVQQAQWKLRAARTLEGASAAAFKPQLAFNTIEEPNPENTASYFQAGFDATWELGLFGRRDANGHLAVANTGAAEAELKSARVSLVAEVVREYLQLRAAQRGEALWVAAAQAAQRKLELLRMQEHLQLASRIDVEQGTAAAAKADAQVADPRAAVVQHAQALALLLGKSEPDPAWLASKPLPQLADVNVESVPADLLRTRPEIRYAETQVLKAAGELGIAKADMYPRLALGSSLTFAALVKGRTRLGDVNNTFAIGPIINIPLFDWGQRCAMRARISCRRRCSPTGRRCCRARQKSKPISPRCTRRTSARTAQMPRRQLPKTVWCSARSCKGWARPTACNWRTRNSRSPNPNSTASRRGWRTALRMSRCTRHWVARRCRRTAMQPTINPLSPRERAPDRQVRVRCEASRRIACPNPHLCPGGRGAQRNSSQTVHDSARAQNPDPRMAALPARDAGG